MTGETNATARAGVETLCRHARGYPPALQEGRERPRDALRAGWPGALLDSWRNPWSRIVGSERPTDYGMEMARGLARGLAASRVTVLGAFANGIRRGRALRSTGGRWPDRHGDGRRRGRGRTGGQARLV